MARILVLGLIACHSASPPDYPLHPTIRCTSGSHVSVLGAVQGPGAIACDTGMRLTAALVAAGGFTPRARRNQLRLFRGHGVYRVRYVLILDGAAPDLELGPDDEIVVNETEL